MILGYEKPVEIAPMSIYDNDLFKTYIGALKDDYYNTVADQRELMKTYGNLVTSLPGAQQAFYEATIAPVEKMYNTYGGDLLRDPALRAQLRQYATEAAAKAAPIKQASDIYDAYKKQYDSLTPAQKAYEDYMLQKEGLEQAWDPHNPWNKTVPDKYVSPTEYFKPTLGELEKNSYKDKDGYWWYGVPENIVSGQLNNLWDGYANTDQYLYDKGRMKGRLQSAYPNLTDEQADQLAENAIKQGIVNQYTGAKMEKLDPKEEGQIQLRNQITLDNRRTANDLKIEGVKHANRMEEERLKASLKGQDSDGSYSVTTEIYDQGLGAMGVTRSNGGMGTYDKTIQDVATKWTDKKYANIFVKRFGKKYKDLTEEQKNVIRSTGEYKDTYDRNMRAYLTNVQKKTIRKNGKQYNDSQKSFALATSVSPRQIVSLSQVSQDIVTSEDKTKKGKFYILPTDSNKDRFVSLTTISNRRAGKPDAKDLDRKIYETFASNNDNTKQPVALYGGQKNFIQQVEGKGTYIHQYVRLANNKWYDLGIYDATNLPYNDDSDLRYLRTSGHGVKAIPTSLTTTDDED